MFLPKDQVESGEQAGTGEGGEWYTLHCTAKEENDRVQRDTHVIQDLVTGIAKPWHAPNYTF